MNDKIIMLSLYLLEVPLKSLKRGCVSLEVVLEVFSSTLGFLLLIVTLKNLIDIIELIFVENTTRRGFRYAPCFYESVNLQVAQSFCRLLETDSL